MSDRMCSLQEWDVHVLHRLPAIAQIIPTPEHGQFVDVVLSHLSAVVNITVGDFLLELIESNTASEPCIQTQTL